MTQKTVSLLVTVIGIIAAAEAILLVLKKTRFKNSRVQTVVSIFRSIIRYAAGIAILCFLLSYFGFDPKTIAASIGILTLVIGFSAESLIADVVTGFFMIFEKQYNVGDILEVQGFRGTVTDMGIRSTRLTDAGGNVKIVNNSAMVNIMNRSDHFSTAVADIDVKLTDRFEAFEKKIPAMLDAIYEKNRDSFPEKPSYLGVEEIKKGALTLRFTAVVPEKEIYNAQRLLNHELVIGLIREGVEWP